MKIDSICAYKFVKTLEILKESISEWIKKWKQESRGTIFVHFINIVLIIEQNRANRAWHISSERVRAKTFSSNIEFELFSSKIFFKQFRVRVLSSGQIFERAEQNFEQTAAQSQH